jgi:hypothetical protein
MNSALKHGAVLITAAMLFTACASSGGSGSGANGGGSTGSSSTGSSSTGSSSTGSSSTGSNSGSSGIANGGGSSGSSGSGSTGSGSTGSSSTGSSSTGSSGGSGGSGSNARFNLVASPDNASCNYIPNGALGGADQLSVDFYFLIIGGNPSDVPGGLSVTGSSDTGLSTSYDTSPNNQAVSLAQFALRPEDFGVLHTIKIMVDSANQVDETDESDNTIVVSVRLPFPRPTQTIDPLACTVTRGSLCPP